MLNSMTMINSRQVAEILDYHPQYVRDLTLQGKLPAKKVSGNWAYDEKEITALKERADKIGLSVGKLYVSQKLLKNK